MRQSIITSGLALLLAYGAQAQNTNVAFTPGKLAVQRGGDGIITIASGRQHPIFIDEYDPAITNQAVPIISIELPTNGLGPIFMNAHAGSEGQGLTRSADRQYLTLCGYSGALNSISGTPSSATNASGQGYNRGFGTVDAFTNWNLVYASADWFGIQPGITQNNPRGLATDGTNNFWGVGTIAGTQSGGFTESGTLFWDSSVSETPELVQNEVSSAYFMKIINGVLYMTCQTDTGGAYANGVYNFQQYSFAGGAPVPLPWAPNVPNPVEDVVTTNLFIPFGTTYANTITFDMNNAGTLAYSADETYGIVKWVNSGGTWTSPYYFNSNNIGSGVGRAAVHPKAATCGCFGITVDFSGTNPVIYATTLDEGDGANTCSNRLISLVDTGTAPSPTAVLASNLAVASGISEVFRGVAFTPELIPSITSQPSPVNVTTNQLASLTVGVQSVKTVSYQWQNNGTNIVNGGNISGATNATLNITASVTNDDGNYSVIVSNAYGVVTSMVANVFISPVAVPPTLTNAVAFVTNFIGNNQEFSVNPGGTPPFTYQWYFQASNTTTTVQLADDGVKYYGSTNSALYITNLQTTDAGSYYLTVNNQANGISNFVDVLQVQYVLPSIPTNGEPTPNTILQGQTVTYSVSGAQGTAQLTYQWYQQGGTQGKLSDQNEFSGTGTANLTITDAGTTDAANYYCVVGNNGGSTTSSVVSLTVLTAPSLSYVNYSNQVYIQNFDSLPNPGAVSDNTVGGGGPTTIGAITYNVGNPFDFAYPLYTNLTGIPGGGLNLAATMPGWYGECDADSDGGQLGAGNGSTTTGGIYSFGLTNSGETGNRALGLVATSTSGGSHFGLKLINNTSSNLNYISMQFVGEYWKTGTKPKIMQFTYSIDAAGNGSTLSSSELLASSNNPVSALTFSFPIAAAVYGTNGLLAINQTNMAVTNMALASAWTPGSALWLIWSIDDPTGSGEGYGIDNLKFAAGTTANVTVNPPVTTPALGSVSYSSVNGLSFGFTNTPGAAAEFSVYATTNLLYPLSQWTRLGNPTEVSPGVYQYTDASATNSAKTFYTVTSP